MNKKIVIILEVLFVIIAFGYYILKIMIPEYREMYGSSDKLFSYSKYNSMYEFLYEDGTNFSIIVDKNGMVYHMFFFDKKSLSLYNHKIEGMSIKEAVNSIFSILGDRGNLNIIYYEDNGISKYINNPNIIYTKSNVEDKCRLLGINVNDMDDMLSDMDFYSKEIIKYYKNNKDNEIREYCDSVYMIIEDYVRTNNITNLDINNTDLLIHMIPTDEGLYPSTNSWYYVEDSKIYAYIEFNDDGFCYKGSIDSVIEGMCN